MTQREGGPTVKRGPTADDNTAVLDWANLPQGTQTEYLDASLHDAHVISIRSDLLKRRVGIIRCTLEDRLANAHDDSYDKCIYFFSRHFD